MGWDVVVRGMRWCEGLASGSKSKVGGEEGWVGALVEVEGLRKLGCDIPGGSLCWFMAAERDGGELLGGELVVASCGWVWEGFLIEGVVIKGSVTRWCGSS
jgi:hypothetical protein